LTVGQLTFDEMSWLHADAADGDRVEEDEEREIGITLVEKECNRPSSLDR